MKCTSMNLLALSLDMVEISNSDIERILNCLDIAMAHYKSLKGLRNSTHAWAIGLLKEKINRKLSKQQYSKSQNHDKN
jgi:hypothetical protein